MATFHMFKMGGCPNCVTFFGKTGSEPNTPYQVLRSTESLKAVTMVLHIFGSTPKGYVKLPQTYEKVVRYAPFFLLEVDGKQYIYAQQRDPAKMAEWILSKVKPAPKAAAKKSNTFSGKRRIRRL